MTVHRQRAPGAGAGGDASAPLSTRPTRLGGVTGRPAYLAGVALAAATAAVSGVSVLVNARGVATFSSSAVYTTAKNLVAAVVLVGIVLAAGGRRARAGDVVTTAPAPGPSRPRQRLLRLAGLAYVGVVGGGVAFLLFFSGLAATTAVPAAFLHDSLVVWVALVAWPFLGERLSTANLAAVVLLVVGQAALSGGVGHLVGRGQALVLAATVLWAGEVVVAKALLATVRPAVLGVVRMGVGGAVLVADLAVTGKLGTLVGMSGRQAVWALVTGTLLAVYVATWFAALSRARALDVTSVLVASALVTAVLDAVVDGSDLSGQLAGLVLVAVGTTLAVVAWPRRPRSRATTGALAAAGRVGPGPDRGRPGA